MYGLNIQIDPGDLELLYDLKKKIVLCRPPSFKPTVDKNNSDGWLVWCSMDAKPTIEVRWEQRYRIYSSDNKPNPYLEINKAACVFTSNDVCEQSIYIFKAYYCFVTEQKEDGGKGCYYARNESGRNGVTFGMAQALDLTNSQQYEYMPYDAVQTANSDTVSFLPHNFIKIYLRFDDRAASWKRTIGGVSSDPLFLDYEGKKQNTVLTVKYNAGKNIFELIS